MEGAGNCPEIRTCASGGSVCLALGLWCRAASGEQREGGKRWGLIDTEGE